ncbi:MAG: DUF3376 domain-containing protein [Oscillatoriaceae bacterium SKW80]|nr:DUF3376 domain-containing protein [Oscillatoriaceae bacterium SKYG93]MCX8121719.1 DUF3376 domain-containing protein [Oscillatoriaceae bacterium SKW80]MDW8453665.1 DUF3376 domain-containing protein [Oscillatoriaceae cyanobacterium SKYGB_i_bin93]HIK28729.1 DUF3376 domain-containing protein [Oscillatoriaceae cyanobacterium M7585_C2015_266]
MNIETNLTPTSIPITLNCSGGVSLGAYMAGVLYELTQEALQPQPKIIIDIITGSSAGAMSGTLAAYYLLGGDNLLTKSPEDSAFYQTWVEQADIKNIDNISFLIKSLWEGIIVTIDTFRESIKITRKRKKQTASIEEAQEEPPRLNRPHLSIFSREAIDKITEVVQPIGGMKPPQKPLALLMTVTNLQGILEQIVFNHSNFKTITSSETRQFLFHSAIEANRMKNMWKKVVKGAQASGAFPVAFPPVRDNSNINSANMAKISNDYFIEIESNQPRRELKNTVPKSIRPIPPDEKTLSFLYTDGGILDGLPIAKGIAIEKKLELEEAEAVFSEKDKPFVSEWKNLNLDNRKRLYVYIQPTPTEKLTSEARLTQGYFSAIEIGLSAFTLPWEEHDAIRLNEILRRNRDAQRKQKLRARLAEKFGTEKLAEIDTILDEAIPYRFINLKRIDPSIIGKIYQSLNSPSETETSSLQSLLPIYEALPYRIKQNLQDKNTKGILASDFLGAFGGFFDKRYREHDFLLGRISGLTWLCQNCQVEISESKINDILAQMRGKNKKILETDPKPSDLKLSQKIRIGKLALRALRIAVIESTIVGYFWIVSLGVIKLTVILLLTLLELLATLLSVVIELLEKVLAP